MSDGFQLKPISADAVPEAIQKAERYRLLNDPEQAESICHDILQARPGDQDVLVLLILSLTDQFASGGGGRAVRRANDQVAHLEGEYERLYYGGLVHEREARALLNRPMSSSFAYESFRHAMERYEQAGAVRPRGNDDAILRWNSCVRTIRAHRLQPKPKESELPLE